MQNLTESQIRGIIRQELSSFNASGRFQLNIVPQHTHNGTDSPFISEDNVILTKKLYTQIEQTESQVITLRNVQNLSRISFHGFAADNAGGGAATKKASISGEAIFGQCLAFQGDGTNIQIQTAPPGDKYIQSCNYTYIDEADLTNVTVGSAPYLAYTEDPNAFLAGIAITAVSQDTVELTTQVQSGWKITGILIFE